MSARRRFEAQAPGAPTGHRHAQAVDGAGRGDERAAQIVVAPREVGHRLRRPKHAEATRRRVEHAEVAALGVVDEQPLLVGREAQPVGLSSPWLLSRYQAARRTPLSLAFRAFRHRLLTLTWRQTGTCRSPQPF